MDQIFLIRAGLSSQIKTKFDSGILFAQFLYWSEVNKNLRVLAGRNSEGLNQSNLRYDTVVAIHILFAIEGTSLDQSARWDPLRLLGEEMGRMMERLNASSWRTVRPFPALNVYERGHRFVILAEVPGVNPDSIDVSVAGDTITIRGQRSRDDRVSDDQYRRQERPFGIWERSVTLPESVLAEDVSAELENGILRIEMQKATRPRPQQIPVKTRKSQPGREPKRAALEPPSSGGQLMRPALPGRDPSAQSENPTEDIN